MANSLSNELEYTLEDDAWKDSFDKLLDVKPVLRQLNVLKEDVRVSFNNDSSVENSKCLSELPATPRVLGTKISTPFKQVQKYPFNCAVSPIMHRNVGYFKLKKTPTPSKTGTLQSTVINSEIAVIDYDDENEIAKEGPECTAAKQSSFHRITKPGLTLGHLLAKPHVLFDSNALRKSSENSVERITEQQQEITKTSTNQRSSRKHSSNSNKTKRKSPPEITLRPGKWRKSLSSLRRSQSTKAQVQRSSQRNVVRLEVINDFDDSVQFVDSIPAANFIGERRTLLIKEEDIHDNEPNIVSVEDHKERVLQCCNQTEPAPFNEMFPVESISECPKIGEGVYGEVFLKKVDNETIVCKIIPIEGTVMVNGEVQKTFEQIMPEIVISKELSNLKSAGSNNTTSGFVEIKKVSCVQGKYPNHLIKSWEAYENTKGSENDHPGDLPDCQLYIILDLEFAGNDLETFVFNNAEHSFAALKQIVLTLAVAEEALEFEHRDLHWGNVLIRPTNDSELTYKLSGKTFTLCSMGIKTTIIDYTLSRIKYKNHCFYNDLTNDEELFTATGDYQFDIYRMMRDLLGKNWERFEPKTNIYWVSYILSKMIHGVKYKNAKSKGHTQYLRKMRALRNAVLQYNSACDLVQHMISI